MSVLRAVATERAVDPDGMELSRLKQKVDLLALITRGWDPGGRVFAPAADDPLFGYHRCERVRCPRTGESRRAWGSACVIRARRTSLRGWQRPRPGLKRRRSSSSNRGRCCARIRPPRSSRCVWCVARLATSGPPGRRGCHGLLPSSPRAPADGRGFVAGHPRLGVPRPRPSFGRCLVKGCRRWATNDRGFCQVCYRRWMHIPTDKRAASRERFLESGPWQPPLDGWRGDAAGPGAR